MDECILDKCNGSGVIETVGDMIICDCQNKIALLCFKGNSVGFIYDKMLARGVQINQCLEKIQKLETEIEKLRKINNILINVVTDTTFSVDRRTSMIATVALQKCAEIEGEK